MKTLKDIEKESDAGYSSIWVISEIGRSIRDRIKELEDMDKASPARNLWIEERVIELKRLLG